MYKAIVTGATGGLGRNLCEFLVEKNWEVLAFGRNESIGSQLDCRFKAFDLTSTEETIKAFESADIVFHCAALSSPWGSYGDFYMHNVEATKNVIKAMYQYNIKKLVHVSTPSIYFNFTHQININEEYIPQKFVNSYAKTKYLAEQEVLNSSLHTVIIRPRGIFGEYDSVLVPRLEKLADKGFLPLIEGYDPLIDVTYVGNVVYAMYLCATKDIADKSIFNITNDEPIQISELFKMVMETIDKNPKYKKISYIKMMTIAKVMEFLSKCGIGKEPLVTQYGVGVMSYDQTLDLTRAKEELGYKPIVSIKEGLKRYAKSRN